MTSRSNHITTDLPIERHDSLDSTSLHARSLVKSGQIDGPRVIVAATQTGGVGRFGRAWASPKGGLWCTLIWPMEGDLEPMLSGLGLRLGLACLRTIDEALADQSVEAIVQMKWPNDVFVNSKKVLGLLAETLGHDGVNFVLVGVGINGDCAASELPEALRQSATTMREITGRRIDLEQLLARLCDQLREALRTEGVSPELIATINQRLYGIGDPASVRLPNNDSKSGMLVKLNSSGCVVLNVNGEEWTAPAGAELSHTNA